MVCSLCFALHPVFDCHCLTRVGDAAILGEIQFAFVSFLVGESFEGFTQWKLLVLLICGCDQAVESHADFYASFMGLCTFAFVCFVLLRFMYELCV